MPPAADASRRDGRRGPRPVSDRSPAGSGPGSGEAVPSPPAGAPSFPAPSGTTTDPITQEVPPVDERDVTAWPSFFDTGPAGDDRWK